MKKKTNTIKIASDKPLFEVDKNHHHADENETCCGDCLGKESCRRISGVTSVTELPK
ncbi:MAG: hypothetical protein ACKVQB_02205 [Bacteroidia bacterium]